MQRPLYDQLDAFGIAAAGLFVTQRRGQHPCSRIDRQRHPGGHRHVPGQHHIASPALVSCQRPHGGRQTRIDDHGDTCRRRLCAGRQIDNPGLNRVGSLTRNRPVICPRFLARRRGPRIAPVRAHFHMVHAIGRYRQALYINPGSVESRSVKGKEDLGL